MSMVAHWTQLVLLSLRFEKKRRKKEENIWTNPFVWSPGVEHRCFVSYFRRWEVASSARGAVARCGSSKLRCPCAGDETLHPSAEVRSATWADRGLGGKEREGGGGEGLGGGGGSWGSGCQIRTAHVSKSETVVTLEGWETVASPGAPAPGMSLHTAHPTSACPHPHHPQHPPSNSLSLTANLAPDFSLCF